MTTRIVIVIAALGFAGLSLAGSASAVPVNPLDTGARIVLVHGHGHAHGNRGRHLGWSIGRHRGWSHSHHRMH